MQGDERRAARGAVSAEIDAMQMHEIDRKAIAGIVDGAAVPRPSPPPRQIVERAALALDRQVNAGDLRPLAGDHQGSVSAFHQSRVKRAQHLLGAADGVAADRREWIGDVEDGQRHGDRPSSTSAAAASFRHEAPSRLQGKRP